MIDLANGLAPMGGIVAFGWRMVGKLAAQPHGSDGGIAETGHVAVEVNGPDAGFVFILSEIRDILGLVFNAPVAAVEDQYFRGIGLFGAEHPSTKSFDT